jgi:hypothetical protein
MGGTSAPKSVDEMLAQGFAGLGGSPEARLRELCDREEIRELVSRYAQQVSRRQSPAHLFTDDGALVVRMPGFPVQEIRGKAALEQMFHSTGSRPSLSMPAVHNHVISIDGDEAVGTSWIELHVTDENAPDGRAFAGSGYYEDRLRRVDGRWRFVLRDANVLVVGAVQRANPITKN